MESLLLYYTIYHTISNIFWLLYWYRFSTGFEGKL